MVIIIYDLYNLMIFSGFCKNLEFDNSVFSCPKCGSTPEYLVADGKFTGPTTRKVSHLKELDSAPGDTEVLQQGSQFKDWIFLSGAEERRHLRLVICFLVTKALPDSIY